MEAINIALEKPYNQESPPEIQRQPWENFWNSSQQSVFQE